MKSSGSTRGERADMATAARKGKPSDEVAVPGAEFAVEDLAAIGSFSDALKLVADKLGEENVDIASQEIGDGFKLLDNKDQLCGVAFIAVTWGFHMGDHGEFVAMKVVTKDGLKYIINDGSSGIYEQLIGYSKKKNKQGGLLCEKGLRRSDYKYTDESGEEKPATTYYLDTSAS